MSARIVFEMYPILIWVPFTDDGIWGIVQCPDAVLPTHVKAWRGVPFGEE